MYAKLEKIEYYLPEEILTNSEIAKESQNWTSDKIARKIGIERRHIAGEDECSSDLAERRGAETF